MGWETDGRTGLATVGESRVKGFAFLRDRAKRLIAFHAFPPESIEPTPQRVDQFTIDEDAFEADVASPLD